jgi:hypothetical protein
VAEETAPPPLEKWLLKRQLWVTVGTLLGTAGLLWAGKVDVKSWADVTVWTVGLYMLGEAGATWAAGYKR